MSETTHTLGFDPTATHDVPQFSLGFKVESNGSTYVYVRATAAKSRGLVYLLDQNFTLGNGSSTVTTPTLAAVPQVSFATPATGYTYRYGWAIVQGEIPLLSAAASASANAKVYTTANAGVMGTSSSSQSFIPGLYLHSSPGVAALVPGRAAYPLGLNLT